MMDLRSGLPYHWILNGLPFTYPALREDHRCELLVIGGGITGALCAQACSAAGIGVTVVEARSIGTGSTSASTALLQYEIDTPLHVLAGMVGLDHAARSYHACADAIPQLLELAAQVGMCHAVPRKSLQFASRRADDEALRQEHALRCAQGFPVDLLSRSELKELTSLRKSSALLSHTAAEIDPYAFTHHLLQAVLRKGGQVFDRTAVEGMERTPSGHTVRTSTGHRIHARHVIMATGYESQRYLPDPLLALHSTYAIASERMPEATFWYERSLIWETATPYLYLRTTPDDRVIIGGLDDPFRDPARRDARLARKTRRLVKAARKLFPHLPFEAEFSWCGTFGATQDGLPYIDQEPRCGAWFVLGMGGNGITFSQVGANIVRDRILGRSNAHAELFRFDR